MSKIFDKYIIHFKGLKVGKHLFEYEVKSVFFDQYPEGEIRKGDLKVSVLLDKHTTMLELHFSIEGSVEVLCDRCLEPLTIPTSYDGRLIVKFGEEVETINDELWVVNENEYELNLSHYIYESICISLPIQRYHGILGTDIKGCDPTMLKRINKGPDTKKSNDPRWDKLNELLK